MPDESLLLGQLADEFTGRVRAGDLPAIDDYAQRHPALADRIRALFPTLMMLEGLAGSGGRRALGDPGRAGETFGPYKLVREIGRGGMGVVYEAIHQSLHKRVALKLLAVAGSRTGVTLERFLREARTAAELHHTNIVPVFDIGQVGGAPYYAMQFIEGRGLDRLLGAVKAPATTLSVQAVGALPPANGATFVEPSPVAPGAHVDGKALDARKVAEIGIQVADALSYAHARGVVHRDIKPSNLLLDEQGVVWITDFGLARRQDDVALTHSNTLLGTPRYMSPEQASAAKETVDHRTDIYSLGATLYELLTGRPAFDGPTALDVVQQIIERAPVSPREIDPTVPRDLETVVLKAMAKRRVDRYPAAVDFADDLRRFRDDRPVKARRIGPIGRLIRWAKREPRVAALTGAIFALMYVLAVSAWLSVIAIQKQKERADEARGDSQKALAASLLDQARVVLMSDRPGRRWQALELVRDSAALGCNPPSPSALRSVAIDALYVQDVKIHRELPGITATVAADGHTAARAVYASGDNLRIVVTDLDSGEEREISRQPIGETVPVLGISADGKLLAVANGIGPVGVTLWDLASGQSRKLPELGNAGEDAPANLCYSVVFSPDGRRLAALRMIDIPKAELFVWNLTTQTPPVARDVSTPSFLPIAFAPDGQLVWRTARGFALQSAEGTESKWDYAADLAGGWKGSPFAYCRSKPLIASVHSPQGRQVLVFADTKTRQEWGRLKLPGTISNIAFSPDGERLAVAIVHGNEGEVLYVRTADQTIELRHRAPQFGFLGRTLAWHADGKRLISTLEMEGLWLWEPAWVRAGESTASGHTETTEIAFSPDGRWQAIGGWSGGKIGGGYKLRLIDRQSGQERTLDAPDTHYRLAFRADSRHLACVANKTALIWDCESGNELVRRTPPDGGWESAAFDASDVLLAAAGLSGERGAASIWSISTNQSVWQPPAEAGSVRLSPDGQRIVGGVGETTAKATLWDIPSKTRLAGLEHNSAEEETFDQPRFSPNGRKLVSLAPLVDFDRLSKPWVSLWSAATGRKLFDLTADVFASCSAWSADSRWIALGYEDGSVRLFDSESGELVFRWKPHGKRTLRLAFTPAADALHSLEDGGPNIASLRLDVVRRELAKLGLGW